jgi:Na+-driven multidrug efflux pump
MHRHTIHASSLSNTQAPTIRASAKAVSRHRRLNFESPNAASKTMEQNQHNFQIVTSMSKKLIFHTFRQEANGILQMCWPIIAYWLFTSWVDTVNAKTAGVFGSQYQTAVCLGDRLLFIATMALLAVGVGVNANLKWSRDPEELRRFLLSQVLKLAFFVGAIAAVAMSLLGPMSLRFFTRDPEVIQIARNYIAVGAFHLIPYGIMGIMTAGTRSLGDSKSPMFGMLISCIISCSFCSAIVHIPQLTKSLSVTGIAWGCTAGATAGSLFVISRLHRNRKETLEALRQPLRLGFAKSVLNTSIPNGITRLLWTLGLLALAKILSLKSVAASTALTIGGSLEMMAYLHTWALSQGVAALAAQARRSGDKERIFALGWIAALIGLVISLVTGTLLFICARPLGQLLGSNAEIASHVTAYLQVAAFCQPFLGITNSLSGTMIGVGETMYPMIVSFGTNWLFRLPIAWLLLSVTPIGPNGAWYAMLASVIMNLVFIVHGYNNKRWLRNA